MMAYADIGWQRVEHTSLRRQNMATHSHTTMHATVSLSVTASQEPLSAVTKDTIHYYNIQVPSTLQLSQYLVNGW